MLEKISAYCRNVHSFVYEGSLSVYELILETLLKEDEIIDSVNGLESTVNANYTDINNKVNANQKIITDKVSANYLDLNTRKENSIDITVKRKLSTTGDFTGKIRGVDSVTVLAEIDTTSDKLEFITDQFLDGATGLVIDCGFWGTGNDDIGRNFDGGMWV